jgi:flagellar biosynthesis/type III secretory pathway protein FliH
LRFYDEAGNLVPLPEEAAEQQGLEQGLQQGLEQGLQQGARRQLLRLLTTRFGSIPEDVETRLQSLDLNQLEELLEVALTAEAIAQFENHLP